MKSLSVITQNYNLARGVRPGIEWLLNLDGKQMRNGLRGHWSLVAGELGKGQNYLIEWKPGRKWASIQKFSNKWLKYNEQHCTWTLPPGYKWAWRRGLIRVVETDATFERGTEHWDIIKTVWFYHKDDHINFWEWPGWS